MQIMNAGHEGGTLYADQNWTEERSMALNFLFGGISAEELQDEIENRKALLSRAAELGLTVIRGSIELPDQDPHVFTVQGKSLPRHKEEPMLRSVVPDISIPEVADFAAYEQNPFFPAVAKNDEADGGMFKYFIERPEQWTAMRKLLVGEPLLDVGAEDRAEYQKIRQNAEEVFRTHPEDSDEYQNWKQHLNNWTHYIKNREHPFDGRTFTDFFKYHRFIDTPSDRFTSYRVLASASGSVLAGSLYYSNERKSDLQPQVLDVEVERLGDGAEGVFEFLSHPESKVYMAPRSFQSNNTRGGHGIVLDPSERAKPRSSQDNEILAAHGLSTSYPELPQKIREASSAIAQTLGRRMGIVVGIDWIQERDTDTFSYLETNGGPGSVAFADTDYEHYRHATGREASRDMHFAALESLVEQ
jgi:hypothetical protein